MGQRLRSLIQVAVIVSLMVMLPFVLSTGMSEIDSLLERDAPVLVYVYTDWCHFCAQQKPIIDRIEEFDSQPTILRINAGEDPETAADLGVSAYPTIFIITGRDETGYIQTVFRGLTDETALRLSLDEATMNGTPTGGQETCCTSCGALGSSAKDCEALKQACENRCDEICERALNISWRLDVFCCSDPCKAYNPYGPSSLEFCNTSGYIECVTPLIDEYHACLDECIDRYIAANSSERTQLRANCRTECNEEFYSKLYAQCYQQACPEACKLKGYDSGNFTYWQNSPGSYTGKCVCQKWEVEISLDGPEVITMTQDAELLLSASPEFQPTLSGEGVPKVEKLVWFVRVWVGGAWQEGTPGEAGLHNLSFDQEDMRDLCALVQQSGEGSGSTRTLRMGIFAEAHSSDGLLGRSSVHEFSVRVHSGNLTGRVTAFERPAKHIFLILEGGGNKIETTTDSEGNYSIPVGQIKEGDKFTLVVRFKYVRDGLTLFSIHYKAAADPVFVGHSFVIETIEDLVQNVRLVEEITAIGSEWTKTWPGMYLHMTEAVEYYRDYLGEDITFQLPLELYTFLERSDPIPGISTDSEIGVRYVFAGSDSYIVVDTEHSLHESPLRPEWEYHEFSHYAMHTHYGTAFAYSDPPESPVGSVNHDGYTNPSTQDSLHEGFAIFMSKVMSEYYGFWWRTGTKITNRLLQLVVAADEATPSLEANFRAWDAYGKGEELAVAGILWDLYDGEEQYSRQRGLIRAVSNGIFNSVLELYDGNGDGVLDRQELVVAYNVERAISLCSIWFYGGRIDYNGDYGLDQDELALALTLWPWVGPDGSGFPDDMLTTATLLDNEWLKKVSGTSGIPMEQMLSGADRDADGKLDLGEIRGILLGKTLPEVRDMFNAFDRDGDGRLSQDETYRWYASRLPDPQDIPNDAKLDIEWVDSIGPLDDDGVELTIQELWAILKIPRRDFTSVYEALVEGYPQKAGEISEIFLAHGFFADTNPGNDECDPGEPFRDADGDMEWADSEYFTDLPRGGIKYDQGEKVGNATNYQRPWRRSCAYLPGHYISVNNDVPFYWVEVIYFDDPLSYYLLPSRYELRISMNVDGLVYAEVPPYPHNATVTIWPEGVEAKAPLQFRSQTLNLLYPQAYQQGYFVEHDFQISGEIPPRPVEPVGEGVGGHIAACLLLLTGVLLPSKSRTRIPAPDAPRSMASRVNHTESMGAYIASNQS